MGNHFNVPKRTQKKRRTWCGPYALAVLFGTNYDRTYSMCVKWLRKSRGITGMYECEMLHCIKRRNQSVAKQLATSQVAGYNYGDRRERPTMTQWYKSRAVKTGTYLVAVTGHFLAVRGTKIIDNQSGQWESFAARRSYKSSRISGVWLIS